MTLFTIFAALLGLVALLVLTKPWWRPSSAQQANTGAADPIAALRQQLKQLNDLHAAGALSEAQHAEAKTALERRIVDAVLNPAAGTAAMAQPAPSKMLPLGLAGFVATVAATGYYFLGSPQALTSATAARSAAPAQAQAQASGADNGEGHSITPAQIEAMVEKLAAHLKEHPEDADRWAMLGRSYAVMGRHAQAIPAFKKAMALHPDDAVLLADYADALAVVNGANLEGEPNQLIAQALKIDPNNLKALSLAGTAAFNRKDYAGALVHWEKLAKIGPADSPFVKQIQGGIDDARQLLGGAKPAPLALGAAPSPEATSAATPATPTAAAGAERINGVVTLAAAIAAKASPDDTLFVFARPAEGSRMPLAIVRKQVKDLPLTFSLDDSMAMSPAARLSSAQRVIVGARISKQGNAMAQPGDLQGTSEAIKPGTNGLKIEISQVVGQ